MKRLLLLAGCVFAMAQASAQELPKSFFVTAGVGGSIQKDDYGNKVKALRLSPTINYQLNERWAVGLFVNHHTRVSEISESYSQIGYSNSTYYRDYDSKERSWHFGPQVRYYHPIVNRLYLFAEAQTGYRSETVESTEKLRSYHYSSSYINPSTSYYSSTIIKEIEASAIQAVIAPGLVYFIKPKFGIELKASVINYTHGLKNTKKKSDYQNFTTDFSLTNTQFGASFYF